jgi:hypothetical protein
MYKEQDIEIIIEREKTYKEKDLEIRERKKSPVS